jgi:hypothetical protein
MIILHYIDVVHIFYESVIILGNQTPIDLMEYLYPFLRCALGYHYNVFQWLNLACSASAEVSPEVSV